MRCPDCTNELEITAPFYFWCGHCKTGWMILNKQQIETQFKAIDESGLFTDEKFMNKAQQVNEKVQDESSGEKGI